MAPSHVDLSVSWVPIMPSTDGLNEKMEQVGKRWTGRGVNLNRVNEIERCVCVCGHVEDGHDMFYVRDWYNERLIHACDVCDCQDYRPGDGH